MGRTVKRESDVGKNARRRQVHKLGRHGNGPFVATLRMPSSRTGAVLAGWSDAGRGTGSERRPSSPAVNAWRHLERGGRTRSLPLRPDSNRRLHAATHHSASPGGCGPPQPLSLHFIQRIQLFGPDTAADFLLVSNTSGTRGRASMQVTRISAAAGVIVPKDLAHQAQAATGNDLQFRIQFERRHGCGAGARDNQREGMDGDAPVDAQNAPTGACKTAPNQNAVSHTVHNPTSFLLLEKPQG
jgi:antitoxin component of MazEF toxin-antitoxin module